MNIKDMILLEMCKAMGVPYAYPTPLYQPEEEILEPEYTLVSVKEIPYDHVADGAEYLSNYQMTENEKQRPKLRAKVRKSHTR
jgi:hypothetical protein